MSRFYLIVKVFLAFFLHAALSEIVVLTDADFEHLTQASTGQTTGKWFIKFYAPWCGACKAVAPAWEELATVIESVHEDQGIVIANVDSTENREVSKRFEIKAYPTLKFFAGGKMYSYKGARTVEAMQDFVLGDYLKEVGEPVPTAPSALDGFLKKYPIFSDLKSDFDHILQVRKNAAAALAILGIMVGVSIGIVLGLRLGSKKVKKD